MGCCRSSQATRHDTEWVHANVTKDRLSGAIQRAMSRPPKWEFVQVCGRCGAVPCPPPFIPISLLRRVFSAQYDPSDETFDVFRCDRRTNTFGFTDNITLRVTYDAPAKHVATVVAESHCSNPEHSFDWGQNMRNLKQVRARVQQSLLIAKMRRVLLSRSRSVSRRNAARSRFVSLLIPF